GFDKTWLDGVFSRVDKILDSSRPENKYIVFYLRYFSDTAKRIPCLLKYDFKAQLYYLDQIKLKENEPELISYVGFNSVADSYTWSKANNIDRKVFLSKADFLEHYPLGKV